MRQGLVCKIHMFGPRSEILEYAKNKHSHSHENIHKGKYFYFTFLNSYEGWWFILEHPVHLMKKEKIIKRYVFFCEHCFQGRYQPQF